MRYQKTRLRQIGLGLNLQIAPDGITSRLPPSGPFFAEQGASR